MSLDDTDNDFETIAEGGDTVGKFRSTRNMRHWQRGEVIGCWSSNNHRLQVYSAGAWRVLELLPQPRYPRRAVYVDGTLYVTGGGVPPYYLAMYTQT